MRGVRTPSVVYQNHRGADIYIIGGWRFTPQFRILGAPVVKSVGDLRGKKIGLREFGGLDHGLLKTMLIKEGLDPARDVTWVSDPIFAYRNTREHADAMAIVAREICVDQVIGDSPRLGLFAAGGLEELVREAAQPLMVDPHGAQSGDCPRRPSSAE